MRRNRLLVLSLWLYDVCLFVCLYPLAFYCGLAFVTWIPNNLDHYGRVGQQIEPVIEAVVRTATFTSSRRCILPIIELARARSLLENYNVLHSLGAVERKMKMCSFPFRLVDWITTMLLLRQQSRHAYRNTFVPNSYVIFSAKLWDGCADGWMDGLSDDR